MSVSNWLDLSRDDSSVTFSFELYPARSAEAAETLERTVAVLAATRPTFISVTYGASGSSRDASFDVLTLLREVTDVVPLAHLTSIGSNREQLTTIIHGLMDAGIYDFLALRGDPPPGVDEASFDPTGVSSAELVALITKARERRSDDSSRAARGTIAVAAYPNGHERSVDQSRDIAMLIEKQEAGANFAITQLFFYADDYLEFVANARDAGLTIPVLPGLMPVSTAKQLRRIAELAGQEAPNDLLSALEAAGASAPEIGVDFTVRLSNELIAGGTRSLHLYTFNKHESVVSVLRDLQLIS
jgi:methylenetetrahydrofolate reductase (NADPH)